MDGTNKRLSGVTEFRSLVQICKAFMNANQSYKVYFIKRKANIVTHTLAMTSRSYANPQTFDYVLTWIAYIILIEMQ